MAQLPSWLRYQNQGATRNQPLSPELMKALGSFLPDMGLTMDVFSGGQPDSGPNRVGSHRHDEGNAADVFFDRNGKRLSWENPDDVATFQDIVRRGRAAGITGFGAGDDYMQPGSMHIGFGAPAVWGAGGKGSNAPDWLREAFNGVSGPTPGRTLNTVGPGPSTANLLAGIPTPSPTAGGNGLAGPLPAPINVADHPVVAPPAAAAAGAANPLLNQFPAAPKPDMFAAGKGIADTFQNDGVLAGMKRIGENSGITGGLGLLASGMMGKSQAPAPPPAPMLQVNRGDNAGASQLMASILQKRRGGIPGLSLMG
jgi:hypothetical protein